MLRKSNALVVQYAKDASNFLSEGRTKLPVQEDSY